VGSRLRRRHLKLIASRPGRRGGASCSVKSTEIAFSGNAAGPNLSVGHGKGGIGDKANADHGLYAGIRVALACLAGVVTAGVILSFVPVRVAGADRTMSRRHRLGTTE
jgi:hypothetical protein